MTKSDKIIVLDLDETLISCDTLEPYTNFDYVFKLKDSNNMYYTIIRPHLKEFIEYIDDNFTHWGIFTAAKKDYAEKHIENLNIKPKFLLTYDNCTIKKDINYNNIKYVKKLSKLKKYGSITKMIAIDDKPESFEENYGNYVQILPFTGYNLEDDNLLKLKRYLNTLKVVPNIRTVEKRGWLSKFNL